MYFVSRSKLTHVFIVFISILSLIRAQLVQRWHFVNGQPHWRRHLNDPGRPVLFPQHDVIHEYNCYWMPAICRNARNWFNDQTKSNWVTRGGNDVFTYDLGAGAKTRLPGGGPAKSASSHRRDQVCPASWSQGGTRCPEQDQPSVMPGPWLFNTLETIDPKANMEIEGFRIFGDSVFRSGRQYSCDEFPPASWIEGGIGPGGAPNAPNDQGGTHANTYCAPRMMPSNCTLNLGRIRSENDWQGTSHNILAGRLRQQVRAANGGTYRFTHQDTIRFRLRLINDPSVGPTRVWWKTGNGPDENEETEWKKRFARDTAAEIFASNQILSTTDYVNMGYQSDEVILVNDTNVMVRLGDAGVTVAEALEYDLAAEQMLDHDEAVSLPNMTNANAAAKAAATTPAASATVQTNTTLSGKIWNITAADVDQSLTEYSLKTQQQPTGDKIDILNLGTEYILGQLSSPNSTRFATIPRQLSTRVEGPIQCGPDYPCKDGSCCNTDGKCGFKEYNCGPTCISDCDAAAMCGIDSADGKTPCGLKLCCSFYGWCGTEKVHCLDPEPQFGKTPCQQGFGSCQIKDEPSCGKGSGTSSGRRVGYYQGWNTRERLCDKVRPRQINTRGLTHLFYSFAFFHPTTFQMMPMNEEDISLYGEFTSLKRNGLQTWISIGGWSFNDPGTTETAFSDMVSTAANRATFIKSLLDFMDRFNFQGADIDWEYPSESKRGGRAADAENLVSLMKEIRAAFTPRGYGSSLALAPDYWYLRGFRPADMQQHVDFMGFMSYDLHGPWDTDVKTLGSIVRPQTDITEIRNNLMPLWYDGVEPSKINLGLAYYGRTYTLSDSSCGTMGCSFVPDQGGAPGECTAFSGILSNREIQGIIKDQGITPYFNETAMVKYFTYSGSSWVGYDDDETFALKRAFADEHCLGGTMIWSIDFDAETGGGGEENEYISPESATIIPMPHTTVAPGATFTLGQGAATDIVGLPHDSDQNNPKGPGNDQCSSCSFFRLITSTCCGTGGSVGNPVEIAAGVPVPMDIPLPSGFIPGQSFTDSDGNLVPAGQPLPKETIIPRGIVFPSPFVIRPGQPFTEGENDDNVGNGTLIWISPDIWDEEKPEVNCFPPCTIVFPPWPKTTVTIDYPRITSTNTEKGRTTTITFPPLKESLWPVETIVVDEDDPSQTGRTRTSTPKPETITTWPIVEWWDESGYHHTTRPPPSPPPPPPPLQITLPKITIRTGPPFPTVTPCAYPGPGCPSPGPGPEDPDDPEDPDEEGNPDDTCIFTPPKPEPDPETTMESPTTSTTTSKPTPTPTPEPPTLNKPDISQDKVSCYDSGQWSYRWRTIQAIDHLCEGLSGQTLGPGKYHEWRPKWLAASRTDWEVARVEVIASIEIKQGCEWKVDKGECGTELRKPVDQCDTTGENRKQGGTMENNCIKWRLDPNAEN